MVWVYGSAPIIGCIAWLATNEPNMFYVGTGFTILLAGLGDLHENSTVSIDSEEASKNPYLTDIIGNLDGYHNIRNCDRI